MSDRDLKIFKTPKNQPISNPTNCGAVTAQLLGLVTPEIAEIMTQEKQGLWIPEWEHYLSEKLEQPVRAVEYPRNQLEPYLSRKLFDGFATPVLFLPEERFGHYMVVGKSNQLVFLDAQKRFGSFSLDYPAETFIVFERSTARTAKQHETDYINFLTFFLAQCKIGSPDEMDVDPVQEDVVMEGTGRRKRRKTKRRLLAKRTLRRMNRRRRIF